MPAIGEISEKKECVIEWSIKDFLSLQDSYYDSPRFCFGNDSWFLKINPNKQKNESEYIEVILFRESCVLFRTSRGKVYLFRSGPGPPITIEFTLGMKTADGKLDHEMHLTPTFEGYRRNYHVREWISRTELERKSDLLPSGTLTLTCKMKDPASSVCNASTSCTDLPKNKILQDFKQLFLAKENCDIIFKVKDQEIHAHKAILSVRSPVLASTFRHDMKEKTTGIVDIEDFDPRTFTDFLCFLYCEDVDLSENNVFSLFTAADKYDVADLKEKCMGFIKENLSVDTFCDTITLAMLHADTELISLATDVFVKNADKIIETVQWQSFLADNPTCCNELFIKLLASNKK